MKWLHRVILGCFFTVANWLIAKEFIIDVSFVSWIFIEILLAVSVKLFIFTITKAQLNR